jgi:hypothetical protein
MTDARPMPVDRGIGAGYGQEYPDRIGVVDGLFVSG